MKTNIIFDGLFIILLAGVLIAFNEGDIHVKIEWLFIPFLFSYYLGRYVSFILYRKKPNLERK